MGVVLARTSMSPIVYEVLDFACGITDGSARVVAQDERAHPSSRGPSGRRFRASSTRSRAREPAGGRRLRDERAVRRRHAHVRRVPRQADRLRRAGRGASRSRSPTGSNRRPVPGSIPPTRPRSTRRACSSRAYGSTTRGHRNESIVELIAANIRLPRTGLGDLNAGVAAVSIGERRVLEACERYGAELVLAAFARVLEHGEQTAREALRRIPNGVYRAEDVIDGDGITGEHLPIVVDGDGRRRLDPCRLHRLRSGGRGAGELLDRRAALGVQDRRPRDHRAQARSNDGFFAPFSLTIPPGTVFSAQPPAPTGWYYEGAAFANDLLWKALAPICPDRLGAGSYTSLCCSYIVGRDAETDELFVLAEPNVGGWGGSAIGDGESALIATTDGDTYNFPVEVVEARFPVLVQRYELDVAGGGGAGRRRGGFGVVREYRVHGARDAYGYVSLGRSERRPWALEGGLEGTNNYVEYVHGESAARHGRVARVLLERRRRRPFRDGTGRRLRRSARARSGARARGRARRLRHGRRGAERSTASPSILARSSSTLLRLHGCAAPRHEPPRGDRHRRHVHRPRRVRRRDRRAGRRQGLDDARRPADGRPRRRRGRRGLARAGWRNSSTARPS